MRSSTLHALNCCVVLTILLVVGGWAVPAHAVTRDTTTAGDWNTGGNWSGGVVPVAGTDAVNIDLDMTVSIDTSFGDNTTFDTSFWDTTSGDTIVNIATGQTLTHLANSTLVKVAGTDARVTGSGTLENYGNVTVGGTSNISDRFLLWTSGPKFHNYGMFELVDDGSQLQLLTAGSSFINQSGGTFRVNLLNTTDIARVESANNYYSGAEFIQAAGANPLAIDRGVLAFAPPGGIGGALDDAMFTSLFGATGSSIDTDAEVRLAGGINNITLTGGAKLDRVKLGIGSDQFLASPGGTFIEVTGSGIEVGSQLGGTGGTIFQTHPSGTTANAFTHGASGLIVKPAGVDWRIQGDGTFDNYGTVRVEGNSSSSDRLLLYTGGPTFNNFGTVDLTDDGSKLQLLAPNATFVNGSGGTFRVDLPNATDIARIYSANNFYAGSKFKQAVGANPLALDRGVLVLAPSDGIDETLNDAVFEKFFGVGGASIDTDAEVRLAGGINDIDLTGGSKLDRVKLGTGTDEFHAAVGGTNIRVTGSGIEIGSAIGGTNGTLFDTDPVPANPSNNFIHASDSLIIKPTGVDWRITGDGKFINNGTVRLAGSAPTSDRLLLWTGGPTFENNGTVELTTDNTRIQLSSSSTFNNNSGAHLNVDLPLGSDKALVLAAVGDTFSNAGTISVTSGTLEIDPDASIPQLTGGNTLTGGTWRVIADGTNASLDLQPATSITTIGADANVVMSSAGGGIASFLQLGSISTLDGSLYVHGDFVQSVGASPMNVSGTLGGDGTLNAVDSIVFSGGILDPSALDGGPGTLTINGDLALSSSTVVSFDLATGGIVGAGINDLVEVNGDLTLDGVLDVTTLSGFGAGAYRLFNYTGTLTDNGLLVSGPGYLIDVSTLGQVNLLLVPEPSGFWLLLGGLFILRRRVSGQRKSQADASA